MIGAFRSSYCSIVSASSCSLSGPLLYRSPVVVFLDRGYPCFRNFNSTIPVDVVRVKSYVNSLLDPTCVPVRISINKLDLIPDRIVAGLVGVFRNGGGLGSGESIFVRLVKIRVLIICKTNFQHDKLLAVIKTYTSHKIDPKHDFIFYFRSGPETFQHSGEQPDLFGMAR